MNPISKQDQQIPPPFFLSPSAVPMPTPVAVAIPLRYKYVVYNHKCFCCDYKLCEIKREKSTFKVNNLCELFEFSVDKTDKEITSILEEVGVPTNKSYKLEVYSRDYLVRTKHFTSLDGVTNYITRCEKVLRDVSYT